MTLQEKYDAWKKIGAIGEIVRNGNKMLERIHLNTKLIRQCKEGMEHAKADLAQKLVKAEAELKTLENLQGSLKIDYDFTLQYLEQKPHFTSVTAVAKPPAVVAPKVESEKPLSRKERRKISKTIEVFEDEE